MKSLSAIVLLIVAFSFTSLAQQIKPITSTQLSSILAKHTKAVILDVRTPGEFASGHITNAINIDVSSADAQQRYSALDKKKVYIIVCRTKNRSGVVANYMIQNGFTNVYQITDGMVGWSQNNLPVKK